MTDIDVSLATIDLYACGSPNVFKVLAMLAETGLGYRMHEVDMYSDTHSVRDLPVDNWNGKIPVIVDHAGLDGQAHTVVESGAILMYLAEKTQRFMPRDIEGRSQALQWLMFQMSTVGPMFGQALHFRYIASVGNEYSRARYANEVERIYDIVERRLSAARYLAGESYSIADMAAYPWLARYPKTLGVDLSARPAVREWSERIAQRPAMLQIDVLCKTLFRSSLEAQSHASPASLDRFFGRVRADQS